MLFAYSHIKSIMELIGWTVILVALTKSWHFLNEGKLIVPLSPWNNLGVCKQGPKAISAASGADGLSGQFLQAYWDSWPK